MSHARTESHQRAIDQVAELFPYLTVAERLAWHDRLGCNMAELTVHIRPHFPHPQETRS